MALVYHSPFSKKNQFTTFPALFQDIITVSTSDSSDPFISLHKSTWCIYCLYHFYLQIEYLCLKQIQLPFLSFHRKFLQFPFFSINVLYSCASKRFPIFLCASFHTCLSFSHLLIKQKDIKLIFREFSERPFSFLGLFITTHGVSFWEISSLQHEHNVYHSEKSVCVALKMQPSDILYKIAKTS